MLLSIPKDIVTQVLTQMSLKDLQRLASTCSTMAAFVRNRLHACQKMYINLFLNMSVLYGREYTKTHDLGMSEYWTVFFENRVYGGVSIEIDPDFWSVRETQRSHFFVGFSKPGVVYMQSQPWFSELEKFRIQLFNRVIRHVSYLYNPHLETGYLLPGCCVQGLLCTILRQHPFFYLSFTCKHNLEPLQSSLQSLFWDSDECMIGHYFTLDFGRFLKWLRDKNVEHRADLCQFLQLPRDMTDHIGTTDRLADTFHNPFHPPRISSSQHLSLPSIIETVCPNVLNETKHNI